MPQMTVNGLSYHYDIKGEGASLILLHGFTGSTESWANIIELLADQYQTIAVDLPGHGQSTAPRRPERCSMPAVSADLESLLRTLGIESAFLLGYSMGGRFALYHAVNKPALVRTLVLESASPGLASEDSRRQRIQQDEKLAQLIEIKGIPAFVEFWQQLPLFTSQLELPIEIQERQKRQRLNNSTVGLANSLRGMGSGSQPSLWPQLPTLQVPTLLLAGARDQKYVDLNKRMALLMPKASLQIVPDTGHNIHLEHPKLFAETVITFLNSGQDLA